MVVAYNFVPILSNGLVIAALNFGIGSLIYERASYEKFNELILSQPLNSFLVNVLPFPILMSILNALHWYSYPIFRTPTNSARYAIGLRRIVNAPFNIGFFSFWGWMLGTITSRIIYAMSGTPQGYGIFAILFGISIVAGLLNFVLNYYLVSLVNRRFFYPVLLPGDSIKHVVGARKLTLRFNLEIFVLAVATGPILILGLGLINMQGLAPEEQRPSYLLSLALIFGLVLLGVFMSTLLARSLRRPLSRMRNAAVSISRGDFDVRIPVDTTDEIGDLAQSLNEMATSLAEKERIKDSFGRAVDPRVRDYLLSRGDQMGGEQVEVTILFSDIRGFTKFSETRTPEEVVDWLNTYFERMAECVRRHGGIVNKYVGDAILAVFNAPLPIENHTIAALNSAKDMLSELEVLNTEFAGRGLSEIRIGIGIHTGLVVAGKIGSRDRQEYTVIGDTVNTASRIEGLCKKFHAPLLVSESVFSATGSAYGLRRLGRATVKGKSDFLTIYGMKAAPENA